MESSEDKTSSAEEKESSEDERDKFDSKLVEPSEVQWILQGLPHFDTEGLVPRAPRATESETPSELTWIHAKEESLKDDVPLIKDVQTLADKHSPAERQRQVAQATQVAEELYKQAHDGFSAFLNRIDERIAELGYTPEGSPSSEPFALPILPPPHIVRQDLVRGYTISTNFAQEDHEHFKAFAHRVVDRIEAQGHSLETPEPTPVQFPEAEDLYTEAINIDQPETMAAQLTAARILFALQDMAQTQADIRTALAAIPAGAGAGGAVHATRPITKEPKPFNGDKRQYEVFRRIIEEYVAFLPDNHHKISAALSYCSEGAADIWAHAYTQAKGADYRRGAITWADFLLAMDKQFRDPQLREKARQEIRLIRPDREKTWTTSSFDSTTC